MNLRQRLKLLTIISVISIALILMAAFATSSISLTGVIGLVASIIQIVTYVAWLLQKEVSLARVPEQLEEVHSFTTKEREENKVTGELMSRLVREGAVREDELLRLVRRKEIVLAFTYAEGLRGKVLQITKGQPLATLLNQIGFVRVALFQNLMAIIADSLPKRLRNIDNLNAFIRKRLPKDWTRISDMVKERYPKAKYKILEKWRSRAGFKVSYILAKSMAQDFLIGFLRKNSFTTEFQKHIAGRVDRNQLKKIFRVNRRKVREIMSKISIEFLLDETPRKARKAIVDKEDEVKEALGVETITDYGFLEPEKVINVLADLFPTMKEKTMRTCSIEIIGQSQACQEALRKLGIDLS